MWVGGRFSKRHMRCIREEDNKSNKQIMDKLLIQMSLFLCYISQCDNFDFLRTRGSHFCFAAEVRHSQFFRILRIEQKIIPSS
jgi:hypothetical protein